MFPCRSCRLIGAAGLPLPSPWSRTSRFDLSLSPMPTRIHSRLSPCSKTLSSGCGTTARTWRMSNSAYGNGDQIARRFHDALLCLLHEPPDTHWPPLSSSTLTSSFGWREVIQVLPAVCQPSGPGRSPSSPTWSWPRDVEARSNCSASKRAWQHVPPSFTL